MTQINFSSSVSRNFERRVRRGVGKEEKVLKIQHEDQGERAKPSDIGSYGVLGRSP